MFSRRKTLQIAKRLTTSQLQREDGDEFSLDLDPFQHSEHGSRGNHLLLGFYSKPGLELALEKYGVFRSLEQRGIDQPILNIDTSDPFVHRLFFYNREAIPDQLFGELVLKRSQITSPVLPTSLVAHSFEFLTIEWLLLCQPQETFQPERKPLPGQSHPGLGMAATVLELLLIMCWRLKLAGLQNIPAYYHNAVMYSQIFHYLNPMAEATLEALKRDLADLSLHDASWAVKLGHVYHKSSGDSLEWPAKPQIVPLAKTLKTWFQSPTYLEAVQDNLTSQQYEVDQGALERDLHQQQDG